MSIDSMAPRIVAGSALAGFGLSLGRDTYKQTKKDADVLILFLLIILVLGFFIYGLFLSSVWLFRNYQTLVGTIFKKFFALVVFVFFYIAPVVALLNLEPTTEGLVTHAIETGRFAPIFGHLVSSLGTSSFLGITFLLQNLLVLAGCLTGYVQRKKRRLAWEAEAHNVSFFDENGIEQLDDNNLRDSEGNRFRLKNTFANELEFIAEGRRSKRAYIKYDETGKYTEWSGLVSIAS